MATNQSFNPASLAVGNQDIADHTTKTAGGIDHEGIKHRNFANAPHTVTNSNLFAGMAGVGSSNPANGNQSAVNEATQYDHGQQVFSTAHATIATTHSHSQEAVVAGPLNSAEYPTTGGKTIIPGPSRYGDQTEHEGDPAAMMPPPTAPASMLYSIRPSVLARRAKEQKNDPYFCSRLVGAAVVLFRQGKAKESKALAQFSIDLIGQERWMKHLIYYMGADRDEDMDVFAAENVGEVVDGLAIIDRSTASSLLILMEFLFPGWNDDPETVSNKKKAAWAAMK